MTVPAVVNPQVVDATTTSLAVNLESAPSLAMGMLFQAEAQSFAIGMQNAVAAQHGMRQIGEAITATACARILAIGQQASS